MFKVNTTVKIAKLGTLKEVNIRAFSWLGADPEKRKKDRALRKKNEVGFGLGRLKPSRNTPPPTPEPQEVCKALLLFLLVFLNFMGSCTFKHSVAFNAYNYNGLNYG